MVVNDERFLTFVNASVVEELGWTNTIHIIYVLEAVLIIFNWLHLMYTFYLLIYVRAMHVNLFTILVVYGGQYFFSMLSRSVIIYFQFFGSTHPGPVMWYANYARTICLFVAFYILPFLVMERCFATILLKNYESQRRPWVPALLILLLVPTCLVSGVAYVRNWVPVYVHIISFMALNVGGTILLVAITRCNIHMHKSAYSVLRRRRFRHYSLSERFQLAENIKTCKWLTKIQFSIIFFNIVCSSMLMLDQFDLPQSTVIIVYVAFNFSCTLYAFTVPCVVFYYTPEWIRETMRLINLLRSRNAMHMNSSLRSTFGKEMFYDKREEALIYFQRLDYDLNATSMKQHTKSLLKMQNHQGDYFL